MSLAELRRVMNRATTHSFWGHPETARLARELLGQPMEPASYRPALRLNEAGLPMLDGHVFSECWLLTPAYPVGFRPAPDARPAGAERWMTLRVRWQPAVRRSKRT